MNLHLKDNITIIAICGMSGSGKDTFAKLLTVANDNDKRRERVEWNRIVSWTTRPKRDGECEGLEHHFLYSVPEGLDEKDFFARVHFGGYDYWTTVEQMRSHKVQIYVVDEVTLERLIQNQPNDPLDFVVPVEGEHHWPWHYRIVPVLIRRDNIDVGTKRMSRDKDRRFNRINWQYEVDNNGTLSDLYNDAVALYEDVCART